MSSRWERRVRILPAGDDGDGRPPEPIHDSDQKEKLRDHDTHAFPPTKTIDLSHREHGQDHGPDGCEPGYIRERHQAHSGSEGQNRQNASPHRARIPFASEKRRQAVHQKQLKACEDQRQHATGKDLAEESGHDG